MTTLRAAPVRLVACVALVLGLAACSEAPKLSVDLRTDYTPGADFSAVQTELASADFTSSAPTGTVVVAIVRPGADYAAGVRVAELPLSGSGDFFVRVSLVGAAGATVASRVTHVHVTGSYALTSVIARTCAGVRCPPPGGDATLTACNGSRCVDPRCAPSAPEYCGTHDCSAASECPAPGECASTSCASGVCLATPSSALCGPGLTCSADFRCVAPTDGGTLDLGPPDLGPPDLGVDGGPSCAATETACRDGLDDDCDGLTDCMDADCLGAACDDSNACTFGDACDGSACTGTPLVCASDTCATRTCDSVATCATVAAPDGAPCDDGNACTTEACAGGTCVATPVADETTWGTGGPLRCCGGVEVDESNDPRHCGVCGNDCGGRACVNGLHGPACACTSDADCPRLCYDGTTACMISDGLGSFCQCISNSDCIGGQVCCVYGSPGCRHVCRTSC